MTPHPPELDKVIRWLGPADEADVQAAEHDLDRTGRRGRHILAGILLIGLLLYLLAWQTATAATIELTCTAPTANTDNSPITKPLTYKAYWGTSAATLTSTAALAGPGCKGSVVVPDAPAGTSVTYHVAATASADGMESAKSNVVTKTISTPKPTPNPPMLLTVGGDVFQASVNWTTFSFKLGARVGTIAPGIKCDATRRIGDSHYRVTNPIVWTAGKKDYVVARCEPA